MSNELSKHLAEEALSDAISEIKRLKLEITPGTKLTLRVCDEQDNRIYTIDLLVEEFKS